jgi:transcription initiation factor TFIIIB Brf1 subunit/transcription initiation factor TFIIB
MKNMNLLYDEMAYDDSGHPIPVYHPPEQPASMELLDRLRECGAVIPDELGAIEAIEQAFDAEGDKRAGEGLARMVAKLGDCKESVVLRRVICGEDEPLREAAKKAGVSHVAIWKRTKKLAAQLAG